MKKTISILLGLCFMLSLGFVPVSAAITSSQANPLVTFETDVEYPQIAKSLITYFTRLNSILSNGDITKFPEANSSADAYFVFMDKLFTYQNAQIFADGLHDIILDGINILDVMQSKSGEEIVTAYVTISYQYGDDEIRNKEGNLYTVTFSDGSVIGVSTKDYKLSPQRETYYQSIAKTKSIDAFTSNNKAVANNIVADCLNYLPELRQQIDENNLKIAASLQTEQLSYFDRNEENSSQSAIAAASKSFDGYESRKWGIWVGSIQNSLVFRRESLDCTNFASQCVWSGYGGTSGFSYSDMRIMFNGEPGWQNMRETLRLRVVNNYVMVGSSVQTNSWYGCNSNSNSSACLRFVNVPALWNFVTGSNTYGPKATGYNNNKYISSYTGVYNWGDTVQLYSTSWGDYRHCVTIMSDPTYNLNDVRVAAHTNDCTYDTLTSKIAVYNSYVRILKYNTATFP